VRIDGGLFGMVSLTFYGGVNEIGGNKVLLEDGDARVFLDFGQSFTMGCDFFTSWLSPRTINGLGDYFEFGLLPKLKGLYAEEQLEYTDVPYMKPRFDAAFLSHAHFDHVNHIQFLDPEIPLYLGVGTKLFLEAMEKTSSFCNYGEHRFRGFRTADKIKVGDLMVEPVHVDHSIPAAYGFLIHTSEGAVVYTGDLRAHGPRKDMTEEFMDKARDCEPVAMICEGTRMIEKEKRKNYSEQFEDKDYYVWEREFMEKMATYEFVRKNQSKLVMDLDFYQFAELIDIKPSPGSHFIHSMSEPYSEEDIEDQVMRNWLDHFKMRFHQLHASGHLNRDQLTGLIKYVQPKRIFPIHTENQQLFKKATSNVQTTKYGKRYTL